MFKGYYKDEANTRDTLDADGEGGRSVHELARAGMCVTSTAVRCYHRFPQWCPHGFLRAMLVCRPPGAGDLHGGGPEAPHRDDTPRRITR